MKIAFIGCSQEKFNFFAEALKGHELLYFPQHLNQSIIDQIKDCEMVCPMIYSKFSSEILQQLPNLKYIVTQSTGFDHIDLASCKERGIVVCNIPSYGERSIAEFTLGLMLSLSRNIHKAGMRSQQMNFDSSDLDGFDLFGKTFGLVGLGTIGREVLKLMQGIGMNIVVFDVIHDEKLAKTHNFSYVSLDELFAVSDIVSLHVPYNKNTHHLIGEDAFSKMKPTSLLINTARGAVVDTQALIDALKNEQIAGAAFDVLEGEKILFSQGQGYDKVKAALEELNQYNVLYTPHMAAHSHEAQQKAMHIILENIQSCIQGHPEHAVK